MAQGQETNGGTGDGAHLVAYRGTGSANTDDPALAIAVEVARTLPVAAL